MLKPDDKEQILTALYRLQDKLEELEGNINNFNHQYDDHISFSEHAKIVDDLENEIIELKRNKD
jgi:hypothetical protein